MSVIILFFLLVGQFTVLSLPSVAQPGHHINISLKTGPKHSLSVSSIIADTAYLRVTTEGGHALRNLSADDFLITGDGDTAEIFQCVPSMKFSTNDLAITFVLDNSASMFHSYDSLTKYLDSFLDSVGGGSQYNAMAFENAERKRTYDGTRREQLYVASSEFTQSKEGVKSFWHSYDSIRTELTPLYETIVKGLERIIERRKSGDSLRSEIMIVVTDGADNASSITIEQLSELVKAMPVTLFTVNFRNDPDGRMLWLAKRSHGDHYISADLQELRKTLEYLRKDISYSYKIVFRFPFGGAGGTR